MSLKPRQTSFEEIWSRLRRSVEKIVTLQPLDRTTWDDNFHDIYALCVAIPEAHSNRLYEETKKCLEDHVRMLHDEVTRSPDDTVLDAYFQRWSVYYKGAKFMNNLYGYLNNQFIKKQKFTEADMLYGGISVDQLRTCILEIGELALDIWKRIMVMPMEKQLLSLLLSAVRKDREGQPVHQGVVFGVIQSFVEVEEHRPKGSLELYQKLFEAKFLEDTSTHYKAEAQRLLADNTCSEYMRKILVLIRDEDLRARKFLHASSYENVTKMCQEVMVAEHISVLHSMAKTMIEQELKTDLENMYVLVKPLQSGLTVLVKEFENYVKRIGYENVQNLKGDNVPQQFVENMLKVYNKYSDLVRSVFQNDQEFIGALDKACLAAINYREDSKTCPKASEWLAKYTDHLLRKSAKGLSEQDIDDKLTYAIIIFRYIEDKDIFQKFYQRMLAQRLIHGYSVSMDAEETMITKLKQACGYEFTSKLQRMFTDIGMSAELTNRFVSSTKSAQDAEQQLDISFQIQVLQAGAWPLTQPNATNFTVPVELSKSVKLFEEFYNKNYTGRKLTWLYHLSTADLKLNYLSKPYLITMTVQQMAVLLHFNVAEKCVVEELKNTTLLSGDVLQKNVKSLVECGLLICDKVDELDDKTEVALNMNYTSRRTKFKIVAPHVQKHAEKEVEQVNTTVQHDRKYFLECTIVRIMKARKVLKHNQLIQEVISQSRARFSPEIAFIKKIIEQLIEKQYLQRTENPDEYNYLA